MKNYIVYTAATGAIVRTGQCRDNLFKLQAITGQSVLEGSAASDGSQMIVDGAVVDTPGWTPPATLPDPEIGGTDLTEVNATLDDHEIRLDRIENPYPETITVTISGVTNCPYGESDPGGHSADEVNGTWELTETSPGSKIYELDNTDVYIFVDMNISGEIIAFAHSSYYVEGTYNSFYQITGSYKRGDTINNYHVISYCEPTEPNVKGYGGTLYIN